MERGYGYETKDMRMVKTHREETCHSCGLTGYYTERPGEGMTDDEHTVLVTHDLPDGSDPSHYYCDDCVEEWEEKRAEAPRQPAA